MAGTTWDPAQLAQGKLCLILEEKGEGILQQPYQRLHIQLNEMAGSHRTTKDLDFLGSGSTDIPRLESVIRELCVLPVVANGLEFLPESVKGAEIREDNLHQGARIPLMARLGVAHINLQVDIGFGDAIFPGPEDVE